MMYANSFRHIETLTASGTTTYSPWFDIAFANELYMYVDSTETGSADSESVSVKVERYLPYRTSAPVKIEQFTAITGDTTQEITTKWTEKDLGTRCRFKFVTSGTWTVTNMKIYCTIYAKRN
jgi:hypothetical protein